MKTFPEHLLFTALLVAFPLCAGNDSSPAPLQEPSPSLDPVRDGHPTPKHKTQAELKEAMIQNLDAIKSFYAAQYAPGLYKQVHMGWNMEAQAELAKAKIRSVPRITVYEYRDILRGFLNSMMDYHVSAGFISTESCTLPVSLVSAQGRYFLGWIDRNKLPEAKFPYQVGDEVVVFDEWETGRVVRSFLDKFGGNVPETDHSLAVRLLTARSGSTKGCVEKGTVNLGIRAKGSDSVKRVQLEWEYKPELIKDLNIKDGFRGTGNEMLDNLMETSNMRSPVQDPLTSLSANNPHKMGDKVGFLPALGKKLLEPKGGLFSSYVFKAKGGKTIGYVRIPEYMTGNYEAAVQEFAQLMGVYEKSTDALVIDQLNNPGGSLFYLYALASTLSDKPLEVPRHQVAISQEDVIRALPVAGTEKVKTDEEAQKLLGKTLTGYPVTKELVNSYIDNQRQIIGEWEKGRTLTESLYLNGVQQIQPSKLGCYTKPVMILTNELDFSGGDFFPAILQDNKRAVVLGTRTAGAGGFVRGFKVANYLGVNTFTMTGSLGIRKQGAPLENLGVKPDIACALTVRDMQDNFQEFVDVINERVAKLTEK